MSTSVTLATIEQALAHYRPHNKRLRPVLKRASVAMILTERRGEAHVLMIKRAARAGDPWSGHMAFPGGLMEREDRDGFAVACRETEEEIGVQLSASGRVIGRLSERMTHWQLRRRAMVISPFVFRVDTEVSCVPNAEVSEVLWIPISYLANGSHRERMRWRLGPITLSLPCYRYEGHRIWGLSLMMLDELMGLLHSQSPYND